MQTEITFYRDPETPLMGTTPSTPWKYPGAALSASSARIYPGTSISLARWVLVWNPCAGATYNAVRLISADDGPTNEQQIAFVNANNTSTPIVSAVDITTAINTILCGASSKQILMQTCGDSASKIYRSSIELVWA